MDLRRLEYFVAVAEERSFTRAAARLHVAQPALSVQVRRLEAELGVALFDRTRRQIALTAAGALLLDEARRLLGGLRQTVELVRRTGAGSIGRLAVGFVPSAANVALPPLLRRFIAAHPDVDVALREMAPDALIRGLRDDRLDVCFLYLPFEDPALATRVVSRERFLVALPADHRLADVGPIDVAALAEEPFILPARHGMPGLHAQTLAICRAAGFAPQPVQDDVWLVNTITGLVAAGVGVALVPASAEALGRTGIVLRALRHDGGHEVELAAVWRREHGGPVLAAFLAAL